MKVRGKLTSPTGAFDFSGYRVRVRFRQLAPLPGLEGDPEATLMGPAETSAATNASGDYEISLDDALKPGGPFEWAVLAPDGRVVDETEWNAQVGGWLPSRSDREFIQTLMHLVVEPGKFANWIAPPAAGINKQPVSFEYVRFA